MQKAEKVIKSYLDTAMGYSVLMIALGLIFLIFPGISLDVIRWILSVGLMALGLVLIINDLTKRSVLSMFSGAIGGVLLFVMGLVIMMHPAVMEIVPIVLGIWIIVSSVFSLRLAAALRSTGSAAASALMSVVSIICGVLLITRPGIGNIAIMVYVGIMLIIYAVSSLVDLIVIRSHVDRISKYFDEKVKFIDLGVKDTKKK
ncbi:DUF308 domain-containing protein [Candidatus Saccharibacteria bacterium]|nr:DUF308 domain-containing protein [Candidatus Saccharibacteria bacterium]